MLGPFEEQIRDKRDLLIVPSGPLTALPFHLLVTDLAGPPTGQAGSDPFAPYRNASWLLKRHAIAVLPAISSLKALRSLSRSGAAPKAIVGFGDPVFGPEKPLEDSGPKVAMLTRAYAEYWQGAGVDRKVLSQSLARLPGTADELKNVALKLGGSVDDIYLRERATETNVKSLPLTDYRIVYFATHGLVAGDIQGVGEPSLALTLPTAGSPRDDGLLTASEVAQLRLNADWVVLSACNTIAGDKPGAEALSGLARAFFYAGARALLVSHWAMDTDAATRLTTRTFDVLQKSPDVGRAGALRQAMLDEMNDTSEPRNAYPAFWAPLVLVGVGAAR